MFTLSEDVHTYAQSKFEYPHSAACTNRIKLFTDLTMGLMCMTNGEGGMGMKILQLAWE